MLKKFLSHWQYGIKVRVADGALVAAIETAVEPTYVRIDLTKIGTATLAVQHRESDYELVFVQNRADQILVARFEVREAAEVARHCIVRALACGSGARRFRSAFSTTVGVLAAILVFAFLLNALLVLQNKNAAGTAGVAAPLAGTPANPASLLMQPGTAPAPRENGVPMSADEFLNR